MRQLIQLQVVSSPGLSPLSPLRLILSIVLLTLLSFFIDLSLSLSLFTDAVVHEIGSSATLGNDSSSPETDGAYVIPTAMLKKDGYILAWEFVASKGGSIRIQVRI